MIKQILRRFGYVKQPTLEMDEDFPTFLTDNYRFSCRQEFCEVRLAARADHAAERRLAIRELRKLCRDFGDTRWTYNTSMVDIIENHLGKHLYNGADLTKAVLATTEKEIASRVRKTIDEQHNQNKAVAEEGG